MKTNQQEDQGIINVPHNLRKIENETGSECWVTLSNPNLSSNYSGDALPNIAPGDGDICVVSNGTVYACTAQSVYQAGIDSPVLTIGTSETFFRTMCQIEDVLYLGSDDGLYYFNTNDGSSGSILNTSPISSVTAIGETLYVVSAQEMYSFTINSEEPSQGVLSPSLLGFNSVETVFAVGIVDTLYLVISMDGVVSVSEYSLVSNKIIWSKNITPCLGITVSNVLGVDGIYAYHNNSSKSNHFLYLINQEQEVCVTYLESANLNTSLVASPGTVSALASSPYDSKGLGENTYLYGLSSDSNGSSSIQINPALNTPIYLALRENIDALTTVLPNNSFIFEEGSSSQSTLEFQSVNGTQLSSIRVYHSSEPFENYNTRFFQVTSEGTYGIDFVAYEPEPGDGYSALMAIVKAPQEGGVVIIGEMDLDPVENDPSAPNLN